MPQPEKLITSVHYLTPQSYIFENISDPKKDHSHNQKYLFALFDT